MITVQLSKQTGQGAFNLCRRTLQRLGFAILDCDEINGCLSASKNMKGKEQLLFVDVQLYVSSRTLQVILQTSLLADEENPIVASIFENQFLEALHDLVRMTPPDNPRKLSNSDYGLIAGLYP